LRGESSFLTFAGAPRCSTRPRRRSRCPTRFAAELASSLRAKRDRLADGLRGARLRRAALGGTYFLNATAHRLGEHDATPYVSACRTRPASSRFPPRRSPPIRPADAVAPSRSRRATM